MDKPYILIAEDDEDDQFLLASAFRENPMDMELVFVQNGIELLNHFQLFESGEVPHLPALLIVDLNMPKKNGKEALQELTKKNYFGKFPTVIFSTTGNELEKNRCSALGIDDFFVKPSNYGSLLNIVAQFQLLARQVREI
jgi:CheY-like chemotaxis protein